MRGSTTSTRFTRILRPQNESTPPVMTSCLTVAKYGVDAPGALAMRRSLRMTRASRPRTMSTSRMGAGGAGGAAVRRRRAGRGGDAQVFEDDARLAAADDVDVADGDGAAEAGLEGLGDAEAHEVGEAVRAGVPPAAADDQHGEEKNGEAAAGDPAQTSPHRPAPLTLPRRAMMVVVNRRLRRHSDARPAVLAASQDVEIATVIAGRGNHNRFS